MCCACGVIAKNQDTMLELRIDLQSCDYGQPFMLSVFECGLEAQDHHKLAKCMHRLSICECDATCPVWYRPSMNMPVVQ